MVISMRNTDGCVSPASIHGTIKSSVEHINRFSILWISVDPGIIKRTLPQSPLFIYLNPAFTPIIRPKDSTIFCFYYCPESVSLCWRGSYSDFSKYSRWESLVLRNFNPCITSIGRLKKTTSSTSTR